MDTADDDLMQLVLDGAATPTERARLERRMEQDRALRARFEAMERGFRALDARPVEAAPAGLREDILAAIAAEPEPARARPSWFTRWFTSAITLDSTSHPASARRAGHHPQEVQMNNRNAIIGAIAAVALVVSVSLLVTRTDTSNTASSGTTTTVKPPPVQDQITTPPPPPPTSEAPPPPPPAPAQPPGRERAPGAAPAPSRRAAPLVFFD